MKAVVFDLDDTLYPEQSFVLSGFGAVALWAQDALGLPPALVQKELSSMFQAGVRGDTFDRWLEGRGLEAGRHVGAMVEVYRQHRPQIYVDKAVVTMLKRLRRNHSLGLVTDGPASMQRAKVEALELSSYFDAMVFTDELGSDAAKPSRKPFETILELLGVSGSQAVYVADNPGKDFLGARGAGMATIRFRSQVGVYRHVEPASPDHCPDQEVDDLVRLEELLTSFLPAASGEVK